MRGARRTLATLRVATIVAVFVAATGASAGASGPWVPSPGLHWQFQLQGVVRTNLCARPWTGGTCVRPDVYEVDLYANDGVSLNSAAVAAVHAAGARAVCYVDAGTWENWRPDEASYPSSVLGLPDGWPGERWVDIRATSVLLPIIEARVAKCVQAGFDAVDFDNVDGYTNTTGFPLSSSDQLAFDSDLAGIAHADGLSVALKNDLGQLGQLQGTFDFAVNEQCAQYRECGAYAGWTAAGKAVVEIEYHVPPRRFCPAAATAGIDAVSKSLALTAKPWRPCR